MTASGAVLFLSVAGMELSWRYACATFLTSSILHQRFPLPEAVGSFLLASTLASLSQGRGWRVVAVLSLQLVGFVPALWRMAHIFHSWSGSFSEHINPEFFNGTMGPAEWLILMLLLLWGFLFWGSGASLVQKPTDYLTLCQRFDLGLGAFFLLLLARYALVASGPNRSADSLEWPLCAFFVFALTAIALARSREAASTDSSSGSHGIGTALSFTAAVLLLGTAGLLFSLPRLTGAAQAGYGVLKTASRPLVSVCLALARFLMGQEEPGLPRTPLPKSKLLREATGGSDAWQLGWVGEALAWLGRISIGLAILSALCATIYFMVGGLLARTDTHPGRRNPLRLAPLWARFRGFVSALRGAISRALDRSPKGIALYTSLQNWGRRSGLRRGQAETPREYGSRLGEAFPAVGEEVRLIVDTFQLEFYGETDVCEPQLAAARAASRRLRSPAHWTRRLRARLLQPRRVRSSGAGAAVTFRQWLDDSRD